jgi:carbonic anhydrase
LVNNTRKGKMRKKLKVDLEVKWGKAKEESRRKEKRVRRAVRAQVGRISSSESYRRTVLGNGTAVTARGSGIDVVAPTRAVR